MPRKVKKSSTANPGDGLSSKDKRRIIAALSWSQLLECTDPCTMAKEWVRKTINGKALTMQDAWNKCTRPDWMEWLLDDLLDESVDSAFYTKVHNLAGHHKDDGHCTHHNYTALSDAKQCKLLRQALQGMGLSIDYLLIKWVSDRLVCEDVDLVLKRLRAGAPVAILRRSYGDDYSVTLRIPYY